MSQAAQIRAVGGRFHFEDRSKRMSPSAGPRWTAYLSIFGRDTVGQGSTKSEALAAALTDLPAHLRRHFEDPLSGSRRMTRRSR